MQQESDSFRNPVVVSNSTFSQRPRMDTRFQIVFALLVIFAVSTLGCSTPIAGQPQAPPIKGYVVGAPDVLIINILPEPEISRDVRVRPDGMISVDLVGDVQAAGRTPFEIAQTIQEEIGRFKRDAVVNVSVVSSGSHFVTIFGEVASPGVFPLDTQTRVSEAIGRVGGPRPFASLSGVRIIRPTKGSARILKVHLGDIQDGNLSTDYVVEEGDLIVVPPTFLAKIGYAIQMVFFPLQPFLSGASTGGSIAAGGSAVGF